LSLPMVWSESGGGCGRWSAPSECRGTVGCTAPLDFLADVAGVPCVCERTHVGHGKRRFFFRRVPAVCGRDVVSVVPGRCVGRVGFRPFPINRRRGRAVATAAGAVPGLSGDACVVAGGVVAAQGLSGRVGVGGVAGSGRRGWASADRGGFVGAVLDGAGVAAAGGRPARGGPDRVSAARGDRRCRCADSRFGRVGVGGPGRGGGGGGRVVVGQVLKWAGFGCAVVGVGRLGRLWWSASVAGLAGRDARRRCNTS